MDVEDGDASVDVRQVEDDAPVKASGSQEGGVEDVGAVGGGDDDDVGGGVEAVHLDEDLVEGLLALVVAAAEAGAAMASDGVNLVYEDDGGCVALRLVEQITYAGRADADEHLDELRAGDREEGHACLSGDGSAEERLADARGADHEHALGDVRAEGEEALRVLQELDDLLQLRLGLFDACDVREHDGGAVGREEAGAALAEPEGLIVASLGLPHHEQEDAAEEYEREELQEDAKEVAEAAGVQDLDADVEFSGIDPGGLENLEDAGAGLLGSDQQLVGGEARLRDEAVAVHFDGGDLAVRCAGQDGGEVNLRGIFLGGREQHEKHCDDPHEDDQVDEDVAGPAGPHSFYAPSLCKRRSSAPLVVYSTRESRGKATKGAGRLTVGEAGP